MINTGMPRSVTGHALSGGIIAFMLSGAYEYSKYKKGEISKQDAITSTIKATLEGGIITACGIAAVNALGNNTKTPIQSILEAGAFVALGAAGVYGVQNSTQCCQTKLLKKD